MKDLNGKVAVVTGAGNGIGKALAHLLAAENMKVVVADLHTDAADAAAKEIEQRCGRPDDIAAVTCDVSDALAVRALADAAVERFGAVHVLCNNAGISGRFGRVSGTSIEEWRWVYDVNVFGVVHGVQAFLPILLQQDEGHILNTGSAACFDALPGMGIYASSKHALLGLSEALARELSASGADVGVSVVMPGGVVKTEIMSAERNWLDRLGQLPDADDDALSAAIRAGFTNAVANGVDPEIVARAGVEAIKSGRYLVCDDQALLDEWAAHHVAQAGGVNPVWPPS